MTGCRKCGEPTPYRLCKAHRLSERYGDAVDDEGGDDPDA